MSDSTRRSFLSLIALAACDAATRRTPLLAAGARLISPSESSFVPVEVTLVPFQEYDIDPPSQQLRLEEKVLLSYVSQPFLHPGYQTTNGENERGFTIVDYDRFRADIIATAHELGVSQENLSQLSIKEAVMLSGQIVAHKLQYHRGMIGESNYARTQAARIDRLAMDELLVEGSGICRNYAAVNAAIFYALQSMNPQLKNTYMNWYRPLDRPHNDVLKHAWNQVSTMRETEMGLEVMITYVDPTWLDTRDETPDNSGVANAQISDGELYNALDDAHFGPNAFLASTYLAQAFEGVIDPLGLWPTNGTDRSPEVVAHYRDKAFNMRMMASEQLLDVPSQDNEMDQALRRIYFPESIRRSIELMIGYPVGWAIEFRRFVGEIDPQHITRFNRLYDRVKQHAPLYTIKKNIGRFSQKWSMGELHRGVNVVYAMQQRRRSNSLAS